MADATSTTISRPAPYLEAAGQTYLDLLTKKTGQAPTAAELQAMSPQIAGQNVLTQQAQQQPQYEIRDPTPKSSLVCARVFQFCCTFQSRQVIHLPYTTSLF